MLFRRESETEKWWRMEKRMEGMEGEGVGEGVIWWD